MRDPRRLILPLPLIAWLAQPQLLAAAARVAQDGHADTDHVEPLACKQPPLRRRRWPVEVTLRRRPPLNARLRFNIARKLIRVERLLALSLSWPQRSPEAGAQLIKRRAGLAVTAGLIRLRCDPLRFFELGLRCSRIVKRQLDSLLSQPASTRAALRLVQA